MSRIDAADVRERRPISSALAGRAIAGGQQARGVFRCQSESSARTSLRFTSAWALPARVNHGRSMSRLDLLGEAHWLGYRVIDNSYPSVLKTAIEQLPL